MRMIPLHLLVVVVVFLLTTRVLPQGAPHHHKDNHNHHVTLNQSDSPPPRVLFMMSSLAISGGNISILQEVIEMRRKGHLVFVSVAKKYVPVDYVQLIMALSSSISAQGVRDMVLVYNGECCWPKAPSGELIKLARSFDIVVATYHTTVAALQEIVSSRPHIMPAYYVQDYEPWFTCSPFDCPFKNKLTFYNRLFNKLLVTKESHFKYTSSTYSAVNGRVFLFAKTNWIKNMVEKFHKNTLVHLVVPSIDHTVYYPDQDTINSKSKQARIMSLSMNMKSSSSSSIAAVRGTLKIKVIAMLRPRTPRRNTMTCLDTLLKLAYDYQSMVQVSFFGVDKILFGKLMSDLVDRDGPARHRSAKNIKVLGLLKQRLDLANLYRKSDVFVDMSWWQAFGRTAVEAMACGCVPIMPSVGAASDVCDGGYVCPYHDGTDPTGYYEVIELLVHNHTERLRMVKAGIEKSHGFSIRKAANSIEIALNGGLIDYRKAHY